MQEGRQSGRMLMRRCQTESCVQQSFKATCWPLKQQHSSPIFWTSSQQQVNKRGEQTVLVSRSGTLAEGQGEEGVAEARVTLRRYLQEGIYVAMCVVLGLGKTCITRVLFSID